MRLRQSASVGSLMVFAGIIALLRLTTVPVAGQVPSETPWGHPDLQGVWASDSATPLERLSVLGNREFLTDEEVALLQQKALELFNGETDAAFGDSVYEAVLNEASAFTSNDTTTGNYNQFWLIDRWFENRTSLIVDPPDGRIPQLTPEGELRRQASVGLSDGDRGDGTLPVGPEDLNGGLRCTGGRLPMTGRGYNSNYQIVQSPDYVVINMEMMHDARIIPLDRGADLHSDIRSHLGDSRGHWDGDTLVVETTNLRSGGQARPSTGEHLRLTERFSRMDANTLRYEFTVEDPTTWTKPWTAVIFMRPAPGTGLMYEFACHEGNYAIRNTLAGARAQERAGSGDSR